MCIRDRLRELLVVHDNLLKRKKPGARICMRARGPSFNRRMARAGVAAANWGQTRTASFFRTAAIKGGRDQRGSESFEFKERQASKRLEFKRLCPPLIQSGECRQQTLRGHEPVRVPDELVYLGPVGVPVEPNTCLLYTSPSPRDRQKSRMPSSA